MSPNKGETAVCGSSIFVGWLRGRRSLVAINRTSVPQLAETPILVWQAGWRKIQWLFAYQSSLRSGLLRIIPPITVERLTVTLFDCSLPLPLWNHKCLTCGGYRGSQSSSINHQYATLMSPNKGETAVCGSSIFVGWLRGRRSLVAINRTSVPQLAETPILVWQAGWRKIQWLFAYQSSLRSGLLRIIPPITVERLTVTLFDCSLPLPLWNHKCLTCGGYRGSQSSSINHQYATLMSPNKGETAVCGSSIFVGWLRGRRSLVAINRTSVPQLAETPILVWQAGWRKIQWLFAYQSSLRSGLLRIIPPITVERLTVTLFDCSLPLPLWNHKCLTCGGYRGSQSSSINHQYATLMSPNKGETAVCGSSIFVGWLRGRRSLVAINRTSVPQLAETPILVWQAGWRKIQWLFAYQSSLRSGLLRIIPPIII